MVKSKKRREPLTSVTEPGALAPDPRSPREVEAVVLEAKKTAAKGMGVPAEAVRLAAVGPDAQALGLKPDPVYAFATKSRCPRCGTLGTGRYSSKGDTQYRKCGNAVCRHRYKQRGKAV